MSLVLPNAREKYERREEQNFREWVRRNVESALQTAANATTAAESAAAVWAFANLPVYADETAAGVGGLIQGQFYRTATGVLMVKL